MKKYISRLHFLTQDLPGKSHIKQAQIACEAGANWIQYRCFSKQDDEMLVDLNYIAAICDDWGATLIVTDHVHLLKSADIQGVHLENMQADFVAIRTEIGDDKTLGASANNIQDIVKIHQSGSVDYIGCGPFSHTETKANDYPHLKFEGYQAISNSMAEKQISIPVLAVGGVSCDDVNELMETGIYGIAVSAAINKAINSAEAYKEIHRIIY